MRSALNIEIGGWRLAERSECLSVSGEKAGGDDECIKHTYQYNILLTSSVSAGSWRLVSLCFAGVSLPSTS